MFNRAELWHNGVVLVEFYIFLSVLTMMALFAFGFKLFSRMTRDRIKKKPPREGKAGEPGVCPVCAIVLEGGQRIKSAVFPGGEGRICHIFGCPHCLPPQASAASRRECPVCKSPLKNEEYLIARVFDHPGRKSHVHVLGCVHCRLG